MTTGGDYQRYVIHLIQFYKALSKACCTLVPENTSSGCTKKQLSPFQTQFGDIENKLVLDAGCGTGMLSFGASLLGAGAVVALDVDDNALEVLQENLEDTGVNNIDAVQCDFLSSNICR